MTVPGPVAAQLGQALREWVAAVGARVVVVAVSGNLSRLPKSEVDPEQRTEFTTLVMSDWSLGFLSDL